MKRMERAIATIEKAETAGEIYNTDYKDLKMYLSNAFEEAGNSLRWDAEKVLGRTPEWDMLYWATPYELRSLGKFEREMVKLKDSKVYGDIQKFISDWKPYAEVFLRLKDKVVMGRKPNLNPSENRPYSPPLAQVSQDSLRIVKDALNKVVDKQYGEYVADMYNMMVKWAVGYVEDMEKTLTSRRDLRKYFGGDDGFRMDVCNKLTEDKVKQYGYSPMGIVSVKLKDDYESIAKNMAIRNADDLKERFIAKNLGKISTVVSKKNIIRTEVNWGSLGGGMGFSGEITFEFDDGASFVVYNQAVSVYNVHNPFMRFPTTFHNVKFSDGKFKKMMSEQEMNEVWK